MVTPKTGVGRGSRPEPIEKKRRKGTAPGAGPTPDVALAVVELGSLPVVPEGYDEVAASAWLEIWDAGRRHLSEKHDRLLIDRLCKKLMLIHQLEDWLSEDVSRRWYTTANGQTVTHPAVKQLEQADAQVTAWLSMLGFSPSDRARLGLAEVRIADALDEFRKRKEAKRNATVIDATVVGGN
jgi:P27 family predicted phage terminase small subunit